MPPKATKPVPKSSIEAGSGTGGGEPPPVVDHPGVREWRLPLRPTGARRPRHRTVVRDHE